MQFDGQTFPISKKHKMCQKTGEIGASDHTNILLLKN